MSTLYKTTKYYNSRSGNISITREELQWIQSGSVSQLNVNGNYIQIQYWMLESIKDMDSYILFPYKKKSFLNK